MRLVLTLSAIAIALTSCGDGDDAAAHPRTPATTATTPTVGVRIVDRIPHDTAAFTQGLVFHGGKLYESTGLAGSSSLRRVEPYSGAVEAFVSLPNQMFAEGIAVVGDRLYQLTWKSGIAIVYDVATFAVRDTLHYEGEGWGLTTYGDSLIMSDGTSRLRVLDPADFRVIRTFEVIDAGVPVKSLNELEYIDGEIWANVWRSTTIARIDPASGHVRGWVDVSDVRRADPSGSDENVTNGIAYDATTGRILITGKRWSWMYVVEVQR